MNRCLIVLALVIVASAPAVASTDLVREGIDRMKSGDFEGALARFKDAQIENPESAELHFNIGLANYRLERWDEAAAAFESASFTTNRKLESRALFHLGNCAFRQGKLKESVESYNRALDLDEDYEDAKVNREFVMRKIKELAKKEKEQKDKQKEERRIIEKLQELIAMETGLHAGARFAMSALGMTVQPTPIREFEEVLDGALYQEGAENPFEKPEDANLALAEIGKGQAEVVDGLDKLLEEVAAKLGEAAAAPSPGGAPAGGGQDPELEKLKKAQPFMLAAKPYLESAAKGAADLDWVATHAGQQEGLAQLLKALNELQDELTRIILEQVQLVKDTTRLHLSTQQEDETARPPENEVRDSAVDQAGVEKKLRARTTGFARGLEQQARMMQQQIDQGGGQISPQQLEQMRQQVEPMQKALEHLTAATQHMESAERELVKPALEEGLAAERSALEELVEARNALSPPQQGGDQGEQKEQEKKQDQQQDEKNENEQDQQKDQKKQDGEDGDAQQQKKKPEERKLSPEQARKMLERARQREKDRRRKNKDEMKKLQGAGGPVRGRDW